jgi:hypothetical protein
MGSGEVDANGEPFGLTGGPIEGKQPAGLKQGIGRIDCRCTKRRTPDPADHPHRRHLSPCRLPQPAETIDDPGVVPDQVPNIEPGGHHLHAETHVGARWAVPVQNCRHAWLAGKEQQPVPRGRKAIRNAAYP